MSFSGTFKTGFRKYGLDVLLLYGLVSAAFFGRGLIGHLSDRYIGSGLDVGAMIWIMEWWHYALLHGLNPFYTQVIWAPSGYNLASTQFFPFVGMIAFPVTHWLGPVAAYNVVMLCGPAFSAWTAFLLCRHLQLSSCPSLVAVTFSGFRPSCFRKCSACGPGSGAFFPLAVLVALAVAEGSLPSGRLVLLMSVILTAQALCSLEVLATGTLLGGLALALAFALGCPGIERRFVEAIAVFACSYAIAAVLLSPYLYYFFALGTPTLPQGIRIRRGPAGGHGRSARNDIAWSGPFAIWSSQGHRLRGE